MNPAVAGKDDRLHQIKPISRPVGHSTSGLGDEEDAGRHVPGICALLPVALQSTRCDVGEGEGGAKDAEAANPKSQPRDPLPQATIAPDRVVVPEGDHGILQTAFSRDPETPTVQPGTPSPLGHEEFAEPGE